MAMTEQTRAYFDAHFAPEMEQLWENDKEFAERFAEFALNEVVSQNQLDEKTRFLAILATLLGCQATAYLGMGRVFPFLQATNDVLTQEGVTLPLPPQATTTLENRREAGTQSQVDIFGEGMQDFWRSGPEESRHINRWLAANCFGDYYTRTGLDTRQREMITFCFLAAQGGCEPQLTSHAAANLRVGNDKAFMIQVLSQCLPYIGYPRSLNALRCLNDAAEQVK